jgi:hypothetical protein
MHWLEMAEWVELDEVVVSVNNASAAVATVIPAVEYVGNTLPVPEVKSVGNSVAEYGD